MKLSANLSTVALGVLTAIIADQVIRRWNARQAATIPDPVLAAGPLMPF